jgi:hypothetical protein
MSRPYVLLGLAALILSSCGLLPGTTAYREARAREAAARSLIDPASAEFRNVVDTGTVICGEINAKNRMGAYVGFVRFYVEPATWNAVLEPQSELDPQSGRPDALARGAFDIAWSGRCAGSEAPHARLPFDPTGAGGFENESEALNDLNGMDVNMQIEPPMARVPPVAPDERRLDDLTNQIDVNMGMDD